MPPRTQPPPPRKKLEPITCEDVKLIYRNFSGEARRFNPKGKRNFCVMLPDDVAHAMKEDGYHVRWLDPREEGDSPQAIVKVNVLYSERARPPRVVLITTRGKTKLGEDEISLLDWARITECDLIFRPYERVDENDGRRTVTAWLTAIYATIEEDALEQKYYDVPDSAQAIIAERGVSPDDEPPF